ncbi:MAG: indole-3-glycerol-phosphate synthase [Candidatus Desulfofervidaceae bacterium]|nr:indole-3-glycerol-phosphate synthase [Candidatus Desulfofervidaceae bacterium]
MSLKRSLVKNIRRRQEEGFFPVISEIKLRSKKAGDLLHGRDPLALVQEMATCPVAGISVVTEPRYFGGSMELLKNVAQSVDLPILHKDFIKTTKQIEESAKSGASAILLIASMLEDQELIKLLDAASKCGLESLLEVHTISEMQRVQQLPFDLLGINNRDITILEVDDTDVGHTEKLARYYNGKKPVISESSISTPDEVRRAGKAGADAVLVGTAVMCAPSISQFLKEMTSVGWPV